MKKFLLIIFLFFCCINVFAEERSFAGSEYLDNIYYVKSTGGNTQYRRAQVIRDTATGEIAYCVEPFGRIIDNNLYDGVTSFDLRFGLSEEKWEKIKLYAYYGYGYKNHQNKEWISITQMMIWRTIYPSYTFEYVDNTSTGNIISRFENEFNELNALVNNHSTLPSFETEYIFSIGDNITLSDSNNVLNNYKIINSDFNSEIQNNSLNIDLGNVEKEGKIILQRASDTFPETVKFFYSESSQNVMKRGNINPINIELKITVKSGKIIVNKIDSETQDKNNQGEANLNGSVFELLNENKEVINELTIKDNSLIFDNIPFGKYYIREKKAGEGYYLNKKEYEIIIDKNNLEKEIDIDNQVIKSKVKITKYYGTKEEFEKGKMKIEKNIVFIIYDKNGKNVFTGATNEEGFIEVDLPYGSYEIEQINTTLGYKKVDNYKFTINEENSISYSIVLNDFKIKVPNAYISYFKSIYNYVMETIYA